MQLTFTVPKETTSRFVIAVNRTPADLPSVVPWRMSAPHRRQAAVALGSPRLTITRHGPSHVVVSSTASPSCQPRSAQVARAAARAVAKAYDGVIDDPLTGHVISGESGGEEEPGVFHLADDWLGWQIDVAKDAACSHRGVRSSACTPLSVSSRGLRRFGMPEITLDGPVCGHGHRPVEFLRMVAQRLLTEHLSWLSANPSIGVRAICDHVRIHASRGLEVSGYGGSGCEGSGYGGSGRGGSGGVGRGPADWGAAGPGLGEADPGLGKAAPGLGEGSGGGRRFVVVRLSRDGDGPEAERLKVGPPVEFDGDADDWVRPACEESVFGRRVPGSVGGTRLRAA
ncbi:hypothetical protein AB0K60_05385 [Thermopolyspora sp. NPDC052614]|uniref:hypothetical protein n=1 Tax=Thermopolyspora sp. NPDC052614 TaxID=3155682 RepID=UPI00341DD3C1